MIQMQTVQDCQDIKYQAETISVLQLHYGDYCQHMCHPTKPQDPKQYCTRYNTFIPLYCVLWSCLILLGCPLRQNMFSPSLPLLSHKRIPSLCLLLRAITLFLCTKINIKCEYIITYQVFLSHLSFKIWYLICQNRHVSQVFICLSLYLCEMEGCQVIGLFMRSSNPPTPPSFSSLEAICVKEA